MRMGTLGSKGARGWALKVEFLEGSSARGNLNRPICLDIKI